MCCLPKARISDLGCVHMYECSGNSGGSYSLSLPTTRCRQDGKWMLQLIKRRSLPQSLMVLCDPRRFTSTCLRWSVLLLHLETEARVRVCCLFMEPRSVILPRLPEASSDLTGSPTKQSTPFVFRRTQSEDGAQYRIKHRHLIEWSILP